MKNSSFPARMLSLLLAVAVLFGLASPAGAVASSNTVRYQQVDNSSVSANPLHSADQETDETPHCSGKGLHFGCRLFYHGHCAERCCHALPQGSAD